MLVATARLAEAAPIITFDGVTSGCFGSGCSTFGSPVNSSTGGSYVTFTGVSFVDTVDANTSDTAIVNLGSFSVTGRPNLSGTGNQLSFALQVSFTLPQNPLLGVFAGTIQGFINPALNGSYDIVFTQSLLSFAFTNPGGQGTFELLILDPSNMTNGARTSGITGVLRNVSYTYTSTTPPPAPVPEPASLFLLGTGLAAGAWRIRRRSRR
jgi:hypothetical protein